MKHYRVFLAGLLLMAATGKVAGQNQFHMGQYMLHQPFINPAAQASYEQMTAALFSKKQWTGLDGAPLIGGINLLGPLGKSSALGGYVQFDKIGVERAIETGITYSYKFRVGMNNWLSFGLTGSLNTLQGNYSELTPSDAGDPIFASNTQTFAMPNMKFGVYFFRRNFYVGFSTPNLLQNKITISGIDYKGTTLFTGSNIHYNLHAGFLKRLSANFGLNTSVLIKQAIGSPMQFDLNAQLVYKDRFGFGLSYRSSNELLALLNVDIIPALKLGYAYEFNLSTIGKYSSGSHEVILIYKFNPPAKPIVAVPRF
jgi:type IX secretion system PorP/SprF family membrane protein